MPIFNIPDNVIAGVAAEIHARTTRDYQIPVVGVTGNIETPQIFEIMPFDEIDSTNTRFYAIDGSRNSHSFYNGISLCFYQAGYVCFHRGCQQRLNTSDDPVVLGKLFHGNKMLVLSESKVAQRYAYFAFLCGFSSGVAATVPSPSRACGRNEHAATHNVARQRRLSRPRDSAALGRRETVRHGLRFPPRRVSAVWFCPSVFLPDLPSA